MSPFRLREWLKRTPASRPEFVLVGQKIINVSAIRAVDCEEIENLRVTVHHAHGVDVAINIQAIEIVMLLKPSALESRRLKWQKRAWASHNLLGHPLMQILALLGAYRLAMKVHDGTVPRPLGQK